MSQGYYKLVEELFRTNFEAGDVYEFEHFARDGFLTDPPARTKIEAGQAFQVAFESQYSPTPEGFAWRPLKPQPLVGVYIITREGPLTPVLRQLLAIGVAVSKEHGWLTNPAQAVVGGTRTTDRRALSSGGR